MTPSPTPSALADALADRYRIERELGAGGMATVFLAHDLKHDRKVALKVLKPELAAVIGGARFLSEIKTTANLQHPHILPLHDSGEVDGTVFYVMPFVDGESLRDRLAREKQLPVEDAVRIATEVADALHYAHGHGVIHRDIKPENILLHGGHALVADFGIALAASSTAGTRMTETGMSLGTPQYMSPEQAMGERTLDARTDVYALGCVLYEMLAGDPPFTGSTAQAVVARVLTSEPESLTLMRRTVPVHVEQTVRAALQKLPADRPATAALFASRLSGAVADVTAPATHDVRPRLYQRPPVIAAVLTVVAALGVWGWMRPRAAEHPVIRYEMANEDGVTPNEGAVNYLAVSPDGGRLVMSVTEKDGTTRLWLRARDEMKGAPIAGSDSGTGVAFAPDGKRVAFLTVNAVKIAGLNGAPPAILSDSGFGSDGLAWGRDGFIYVDGLTGNGVTGLTRLRPDGTSRENITVVDTARGETDHVYPDPLPGGRGVLYTVRKKSGPPVIAVVNVKTRATSVLLTGANARYVEPGFIVYTADNKSLVAVPFDERRLAVTGAATFIADVTPSILNAADVAVSAGGTLFYRTGSVAQLTGDLVWVDMAGRTTRVDPQLPATVGGFAVAPDGESIAVQTSGDFSSGDKLFVKSLRGGTLTPLPVAGARISVPRWSRDGKFVYYLLDPRAMGGVGELWRVPANGSGSPERIGKRDDITSFVITGDQIVASRAPGGDAARSQLEARPVDGAAEFAPIAGTKPASIWPQVSPDGRWMAFFSLSSGSEDQYISPFPNASTGRWGLGVGNTIVMWSKDSKSLFYVDRELKVAMLSLELGAAVRIRERKPLFDVAGFTGGPNAWDLSHDGSRFLMLKRPEKRAQLRTFVIENLPALLAREARKAAGR